MISPEVSDLIKIKKKEKKSRTNLKKEKADRATAEYQKDSHCFYSFRKVNW